MSVLIKGMKMPKNCYQCRMVDSCQHLWKPYDLDDYSDLQNMVEEGFTRADNCPLVEIPPHGRLIDASEEIQVQMYDDQHEDFYLVKMTIDDLLSKSWIDADAPTVIEAEEGE